MILMKNLKNYENLKYLSYFYWIFFEIDIILLFFKNLFCEIAEKKMKLIELYKDEHLNIIR